MKDKQFKPPRSLTRLFPQVKQVLLAKKPVLVEVHPKDCKDGKKLQTSECALAKATKRQFKADGVAIRMGDSFVIKGGTAIRFLTPQTVRRELVSFDRHHDFASGTYRLAAPPPSWSKPQSPKKSNGSGSRRSTTKAIHHTVRVRNTSDKEVQEK
jgi:hypothetical protein